jgi:hypothetical protein
MRRNENRSSPFMNVIFGLGLFLGSFVLLYLNEGRVDLSTIGKDSIPINAAEVDGDNQGALVAAAGELHSDEQLGDPELLTSSDYLQLERQAEMYAWEEDRDEDEDGNVSYDYSRRWTSDPENSNSFHNSNGHFNPPMRYREETFTVDSVAVGAFRLDPDELFFMEKEEVRLREGMLRQGRLEENYIFIGEGELDDPEVGDLRIKYEAFYNGQEGTVFGEQDERGIRPYTHNDGTTLYRAYPSDRETALESMHTEYLTLLWGARLGGLVMMWVGMMLIVSPLTNLLGYLPLVGDAGRAVISFFAFVVAFFLSAITIVVSALLHNPIALAVVLLVFIVSGLVLWRVMGRRA